MAKRLRSEYKLLLDANEMALDPMSFGLDWSKIMGANRYPDHLSLSLRQAISRELNKAKKAYGSTYQYADVRPEQLILGTGSDEILKLVLEGLMGEIGFAIAPSPSFSEYEKLVGIVKGELVNVPCVNFEVDIDAIIRAQKQTKAKVIFLANPNNPTGKIVSNRDIQKLNDQTDAWIIVDEAYAEFSDYSAIGLISKENRIIVTRTLSKAYGLASLRIGYLIAEQHVIDKLSPLKMTYNISGVSEAIALEALKNTNYSRLYIDGVKKVRTIAEKMMTELVGIEVITSQANFILIKIPDSKKYKALVDALENALIKVRVFDCQLEDPLNQCIRITITTQEDFNMVYETLKGVQIG